jgi:hypothetical protein
MYVRVARKDGSEHSFEGVGINTAIGLLKDAAADIEDEEIVSFLVAQEAPDRRPVIQ